MQTTSWVRQKTPRMDVVSKFLEHPIATNQFTNGGWCVAELERRAQLLLRIGQEKAVIAVTNGAVALNAIAAAIDATRSSGKVQHYATQAFTFPCSAQQEFSGRTTIVDVTEDGDLDLALVPEDCDGLVVTNVFGCVGNVDRYVAWQRAKPNRVLLFDNAASPMTFLKDGTNICSLGTASIVSLHHTKPIGFGEGGFAIVDKALEPTFRRMINFGFDRMQALPWHPQACNGKMSEIAAAFILDMWEQHFDTIREQHKATLQHFREVAKHHTHWRLLLDKEALQFEHDVFASAICIIFSEEHDAIAFRDKARNNGIDVRQYYRPLNDSHNTVSLYNRIACVPCHIASDSLTFLTAVLGQSE